MVIIESTLDCAAISEPSEASFSYLAANIAVFVAVGAELEIVIATSKSPVTPQSLKITSIESGITISLKNDVKYSSFLINIFLKFAFARNVPKTIIARGEFILPISSIGSAMKFGILSCKRNSGIPIKTEIVPGFKIIFLKLIFAV